MIHTSQLIIKDKQKSTEMGYGLRRGDLAVKKRKMSLSGCSNLFLLANDRILRKVIVMGKVIT